MIFFLIGRVSFRAFVSFRELCQIASFGSFFVQIGIYINPDLTEVQRSQDKKLRDKLKKKKKPFKLKENWANATHYYIIRNMDY